MPSARHPVAQPSTRSFTNLVRYLLLALLAVLSPAVMAQPDPPPELERMEAYIEQGMRDWGIPGLAISVVKDDELVWARGFGVRRLGHPEPVDADTLFNIASLSKAFNAAALGILVDEGRIGWDDRIVEHLPQFRLHDPWAGANATVRDLLAHRTGVGRLTGNRLRWISARSREEQIERLRHLPPERGFREGFVYSNVLYMIAGEVVPAVTGSAWEDFVHARLFAPLGMTRSLAAHARLQAGDENLAWPHQQINGDVVEIPRRDFDAVGPAASVHASATDMAAWMRLHLADTPGTVDGTRILSCNTVEEMHRAHALTRTDAFAPVAGYGLGWQIGRHRGLHTSSHAGAVDGINSLLVLVPEQKLGIFVSGNAFNDFSTAIARQIIDTWLEIDDTDWHAELFARHQKRTARALAERDAIHAARIRDTQPSAPLEAFQGRFDDDLYADAQVRLENGRLVLQLWDDPLQIADLEHWHHDTFRAVWRNPAMHEEFVWFTRGRGGALDQLHIDWNLRPDVLQVGAWPSGYRRVASFDRVME